MQVNNSLSVQALSIIFPLEIPADLPLTDSYGDAVSETEPFRGLSWSDVPCALLLKCFEAPYFFSPEALHYFFPAFIVCSQIDCNEVELPLDSLLSLFKETDNLSWEEWRKARWKLFTKPQWAVVKEWLDWLHTTPNAPFLENLEAARLALSKGIWVRV